MNFIRTSFVMIIILLSAAACAGRGCSCTSSEDDEPQTSVASTPMRLADQDKGQEAAANLKNASKVTHIVVGPSAATEKETGKLEPVLRDLTASVDVPLPKGAEMSTSLTSRLRKKMLEAFEGEEWKAPDVKIYLSSQSLDEFTNYYESKGYKVQRVSVPAVEVIGPVLEQRPDLKETISLSDYNGITINQVMVEGVNVSAADKYIDPETYEVVSKTFITSMPMR